MLSNSQIDRIGSQLRKGEVDLGCLESLETFRRLFVPAYESVEDMLVNKMGVKITGRPSKSTVAIVEKLKRETIRLSQIQDIAGCRVLVATLAAQDHLVENMQILLADVELDDKRRAPTNGYRAVHVIATKFGRPVEIQVRTALQHAWANLSEKVADEFGHSIKYGVGDQTAIRFLSQLSEETARLDIIRHEKMALSQRKALEGKSKETVKLAKQMSERERDSLRKVRAIFAGKSI